MGTGHDESPGGRQDSGPFVLGGQMAAARAAEAAHQAEPHGPSPLADVTYERGLGLLRFNVVPADGMIDEFADRFVASSDEDRRRLRSALTMDDFYTVLNYARRAAVRAIRNRDGAVASRAVAALAAVDPGRIDGRDLAWQAALLSYAMGRISGDAASAFEAAASLAEGEVAAFLSSQARRPVTSLSEWGFREIRTAAGIGFIEDEGCPYRARSDLLAIADTVAAGIEGSTWRLGEPVIGSELHAVWLRAGEPGEVGKAIRSVTGCMSLRGTPASQDTSGAQAQHMLVSLAETESPRASDVIARAAGPGKGDSFAAVGAATGTLCAVLIARSVVRGTPSVETQASLERFRGVLEDALAGPGGH